MAAYSMPGPVVPEYAEAPRCSIIKGSRRAMLIKKPADIPSSEITDERVYLRRREFLQLGAGLVGAAAGGVLMACGSEAVRADSSMVAVSETPQSPLTAQKKMVTTTDPLN